MNPLQIHILAGAQAGARLQLNQSPVTFGRSGDCTLILDLPVVSRLHGELQVDEAGQWVLVNHSSNGTRVGRKKATKKPIPLTDGASINIGDTEVFRVHFTPTAASEEQPASAAAEDQAEQPDSVPGTGAKGRSKLWIGIGIWIGLLIIIAVALKLGTGGGGDKPNNSVAASFYYPGKEIDELKGDEAGIEAIRRLLVEAPTYEDPNTSRYDEAVDKAARAANRGAAELYEAYSNYQIAIAYSDERQEPLKDVADRQRFDRVTRELSKIIYDYYIEAFRDYQQSKFQEARDKLFQLRRNYYSVEDPNDTLANHIRKLYNAANRRAN